MADLRIELSRLAQSWPSLGVASVLVAPVIGGFLLLSIRKLRRMDVP